MAIMYRCPPVYEKNIWESGTDAEVAEMLQKHYNGEINIYDYWNVGDERKVTLSAMNATGVGESHTQQQVTFVLMNKGGKTLASSINGHTECAFVVGQKNSLIEKGYINSTDTNKNGWYSCARRSWCNNVYRESIPSEFRSLFKQFKNLTGSGGYSWRPLLDTWDYFALPAQSEVHSNSKNSVTGEGTQFEYYNPANKKARKKLGDETTSYYSWWTRSPYVSTSGNDKYFNAISQYGYDNSPNEASYVTGLAPFGCI